jgi:hypothetical protein
MHLEKIDRGNFLVLAKDGKANVEIVAHKHVSEVVKFAAEELKKFIKQATGADVQIVRERTGDIPAIILGNTEWSRSLGVNVDDLSRDGFKIKRVKDVIIIAGKDDPFVKPVKSILSYGIWTQLYERATLFGVYEFLERFLGVRFYFPGEMGTVVPEIRTWRVPTMDIVEAPDFSRRRVSAYTSGKLPVKLKSRKEELAFCALDMYRLRSETKYIPNCHGLSRSGIAERFSKSNPEFFSLLPNGKRDNDLSLPGQRGHLCYTNKDLKEEVYKDAVAFLLERPAKYRNIMTRYGAIWDSSCFQPGYFNIMPQDGHSPSNFCRCSECWKYYGEDKAGELVWSFVCDIAKRLKKNGIPGYVTAMAYGPYRKIPDIDIPDNVLVQLAVIGPWMDGVPDIQKKYDSLIKDWNKKIAPHKVWLWNYANKFNAKDIKGVPALTPRCVGSFYKRNGPDIEGAYMESESDQFLFNYLNWYVFFKVAWNNSTDVEALLEEHNRVMFGAGAKPMDKFIRILESLWCSKIVGNTFDTPIGPRCHPPSDSEIWEEIYSVDQINEFKSLFEEAKKLASKDAESLKRIKFIEKRIMGPLLEARKNYVARKREIEDLVFEITPLKNEISIDGEIGSEWDASQTVTMIPWKNDKALVKTTVYGFWDKKYLYLAVDCKEPMADKLSYTKRVEDDKLIWNDASVELFLNPSGDRKNYYQIIVNPAGSVSDQKITSGKNIGKKMDWDWDSSAEVKTKINSNGWQAELKIPLEKFGIEKLEAGNSFVANFTRSRNLSGVKREENQYYTWSPFLKQGFHDISCFGTVKFVNIKKNAEDSLIRNGDFSKLNKNGYPVDWTMSNNSEEKTRISIDRKIFRIGGCSLKISDVPLNKKASVYQYLPGLKANRKYLLTFFMKTEKANPVAAEKFSGAVVNVWTDKNEWFPKNWQRGSMPWRKQGFIIKTGANINNKKKSYIRLWLFSSGGTVWFDDVRLRELPHDN